MYLLEPFPLAKKPVATIAILTISTISILMQYYSTYGFHYVLITEYFKISTEIESKSRNGGSISTLRFFTVETFAAAVGGPTVKNRSVEYCHPNFGWLNRLAVRARQQTCNVVLEMELVLH